MIKLLSVFVIGFLLIGCDDPVSPTNYQSGRWYEVMNQKLSTYAMEVEGGWLITKWDYRVPVCFLPDPEHKMKNVWSFTK